MSTRSITTVRSKWTDETEDNSHEWRTLVDIYVHYDGYLDGMGRWLYKFLDGLHIVNGIKVGDGELMPVRFANGPGRLAAQMITAMSHDSLNPEMAPLGSNMGQEFHYQIDVLYGLQGGEVSLSVYDGPMTFFGYGGEQCTNLIFSGTVSEFGQFLDDQESIDEEEWPFSS